MPTETMHTDVDAVARGFIAAHLWTDAMPLDYAETGETGGLENLSAGPKLTAFARDICARFMDAAERQDIDAHCVAFGEPDCGDPGEYIGHTFYLDAAGSGVFVHRSRVAR